MKKYIILGILFLTILGMSVIVSAGNFRGHNHYGVSGHGHYSNGEAWGWTNSGRLIVGTYDNGYFSGTVGNKFVSGSYSDGRFSGNAYGSMNPYFHGHYWR